MMSRSLTSRILPISALLLLVLFKFQNCAPAASQSMVSGGVDGEVRVVDRWAEQKVSFLSPSHFVSQTETGVELQGLCVGSDKGQLIEFQVISVTGEPQIVLQGVVECVMGGFELPLAGLSLSSCDQRMQVRAARVGEETQYAETLLQLDCPAGG